MLAAKLRGMDLFLISAKNRVVKLKDISPRKG